MATKTFYLRNVPLDGWETIIDGVTQTAATLPVGWTVSTGATLHSELEANVERAASTFVGTTVPDGSLDTTLKDAFRSVDPLTGSFASGNWTFNFVVRAVTNGGAQDGRVRFRLLKGPNANGTGATEITAAQQSASIVSNVSTSADFGSTLTLNPGAITFNNEYLFVQVAWERTGAGGMTTADILFRTGSSSTVGTRITTADFTVSATGTMAATLGSLVMSASGKVSAKGAFSSTLAVFTMSASGKVRAAGAFASTLAPFTMAASGTVSSPGSGTFATTLGAFSMAAGGKVASVGQLAAVLSPFVLAASGKVVARGSFAAGLAPFVMAATGTAAQPAITGTLAAVLGDFSMAAIGAVPLPEAPEAEQRYYGSGGRRRHEDEEELAERVRQHWELLEARRAAEAERARLGRSRADLGQKEHRSGRDAPGAADVDINAIIAKRKVQAIADEAARLAKLQAEEDELEQALLLAVVALTDDD